MSGELAPGSYWNAQALEYRRQLGVAIGMLARATSTDVRIVAIHARRSIEDELATFQLIVAERVAPWFEVQR